MERLRLSARNDKPNLYKTMAHPKSLTVPAIKQLVRHVDRFL